MIPESGLKFMFS